jgi:hypothetical protein
MGLWDQMLSFLKARPTTAPLRAEGVSPAAGRNRSTQNPSAAPKDRHVRGSRENVRESLRAGLNRC